MPPRSPTARRALAPRERSAPAAGVPAAGVLAAVACAVLLGPGGPRAAHAQRVRDVLRQIERAARTARGDSAAPAAEEALPGGGVASGGSLRIIERRVDSPDALARAGTASDTGVAVDRGTGCVAARGCGPDWDLRVTRVTLPGPRVPATGAFVVTTELDNRGRRAAPASELRLCLLEGPVGPGSAECAPDRTALATVEVPALPPGARAVVRTAVTLPTTDRETDGWAVAAAVEATGGAADASGRPGAPAGERTRANNVGRSAEAASELPVLQVLAAELPPDARAGRAFPVVVALRNQSAVAPSPATELQLEGFLHCAGAAGYRPWGGGPNRLAVPGLAPRQTVRYRVLVPAAAQCAATDASFGLWLDPDGRQRWGAGQESRLSRAYTVR